MAGLSALLLAVLSAQAPHPATLTDVEKYFQREVAESGFPGGVLAVVQENRTLLVSATGYADLDTRRPVTADTVFSAGSLTKAFTATAILQLRDLGLLDLDAPVTAYLPWFRVADKGAAQRITLRHLLTHTSGLPTNSHAVVWQDPDRIRGSVNLAVHALAEVHLDAPPGKHFEYANMNYVVLGRVIEAVSGEPWDRYVAEHVLSPVGMTHSGLHVGEVDLSRVARPYWPEFGRLAQMSELQVGDFMGPASNLLTTAPDLARFAAAELGNGAPILKASSLSEAHSGGAWMGDGQRYDFGWINEQRDGLMLVHHGGATGHSAIIYLVPEKQLAVVMMFGAYGHVRNEEIARGVIALLLGGAAPPLGGFSELSVLTWISRTVVAVAVVCPSTLLAVPLVWRRRKQRRDTRRALFVRAAVLTAGAGLAWFLVLNVLPRKVPELPLPFGFHGWLHNLALGAGMLVVTATGWALWGIASLLLRATAPSSA